MKCGKPIVSGLRGNVMGNPVDALFGNNKPPDPPDYTGAAQATAAGDLETARFQTTANRPDEYTPYGSRTWEQGSGTVFDAQGYQDELGQYERYKDWYNQTGGQGGPAPKMPTREDYTSIQDPDKWVARTTLNPEAQKTFDAQQRMDQGLAGLGEQGINQMRGIFDTPFSIEGQAPTYQGAQGSMPNYRGPSGQMPGFQGPSGQMPGFQGPEGDMPKYGEHRQNVMDAMMSRVDTDIGRDRGATNSQLIASGIPTGSEAYSREMEQLDRKQTDARQQAEIAAEQMAGMGYQSALAGRGMESQEGLNRFNTGMQSRGMESAEGMSDFLTAMQARGMTADEANAAYQAQMQGRTMANQEGMADFTTGLDTRRQGIQEALLNRQTPINEMSAFRTGSQVNMPQFQPYGQQQFTGGPNYSQAATQQGAYDMSGYNADTARDNAMLQGLFSLGSAGIGAF